MLFQINYRRRCYNELFNIKISVYLNCFYHHHQFYLFSYWKNEYGIMNSNFLNVEEHFTHAFSQKYFERLSKLTLQNISQMWLYIFCKVYFAYKMDRVYYCYNPNMFDKFETYVS